MDRSAELIPSDIEAKLRETVADVLDLDTSLVTEDLARGEIQQWDSLAHLRLVSEVESVFNVQFTMQQIGDITTFADLARLVATTRG
jgi:acyl carrier protein